MKIQVDNNWWQDIFDEVYLLTDARSVCDENLTRQEVNCLEKILKFKKSDPILDLCGGQGRHSLELSRRGFEKITVLDYSSFLVDLGNNNARKEGLNIHFIQGDARNTGLDEQSFQFIIIMASSFGYFIDEGENEKILQESFRLLQPGGTLLLDIANRDYILNNFKAFSSHKVNEDIMVQRERELGNDIVFARESVFSEKNGPIRTKTYCTRLYSPKKIKDLLTLAGLQSINFLTDFMNRKTDGDFGCLTNRMIVTARKN